KGPLHPLEVNSPGLKTAGPTGLQLSHLSLYHFRR
ncbi:MAG: hypothetical protein JWM08_521, partial [Candidatus Angelobacter sp.]|nr:hypothetical protein [Candidatus Angelobacter sp.]